MPQGLHAHMLNSVNEQLNPIASSAIDHGPFHQPSYPNGYHGPSTMYTHLSMLPTPHQYHHGATNGTTYNHASWDEADHDRRKVDHMRSPRGFAPGPVHSLSAYQEYDAHLSRAHEDGFSGHPVWSSPAGHMDASLAYPFPANPRSYSDEQTRKNFLSRS